MEAKKARYFLNARKNQQLIDEENHVYVLNKKAGESTYWKCSNFRTCPAKAIVKDDFIVSSSEHNHGSNIGKLEAHLHALEVLEKAKANPNVRPRQLLREMADKPASLATKMAHRSEASLTRSIQILRAKERHQPEVPETFSELMSKPFPEKYQKTSDGSQFLLTRDFIDENSEKGFLLFMSPFGQQLLKSAKVWMADGTFWTAPEPFQQIYVICGLSTSGRILPASFALLPDKKTATYDRVFGAVKNQLSESGDFAPETLKIDFELAAINTFRDSFPTTRVNNLVFFAVGRLEKTIRVTL